MTGRDDERTYSTSTPEDEGFIGRWFRRKAQAKTSDGAEPIETAALSEDEPDDVPAVSNEPEQAQAFDVASLPDIDSLDRTSDFRVFMQAGVPAELKTKALRKLWRVKSELANLDGLIDYGEDLTGSFKVVDHLKTAYEVGRGFLKDETDERPASDGIEDGEITEAENEDRATTNSGDHAAEANNKDEPALHPNQTEDAEKPEKQEG